MAKRIVHKHSLVKCKTIRPDQIELGEIGINSHESGPYLNVKSRTGEIIRVGGVIFSEVQPPCAEKGAWWVKYYAVEDYYELYVYQGEKWVLLLGGGDADQVCCDVEWKDILNKPNCFEPCDHEHEWKDITNKPDCFEPCDHEHPPTPWPDIPEKPDCFPPCDHTHKWEQIEEKPCLYHCHDYIQHLDWLPA